MLRMPVPRVSAHHRSHHGPGLPVPINHHVSELAAGVLAQPRGDGRIDAAAESCRECRSPCNAFVMLALKAELDQRKFEAKGSISRRRRSHISLCIFVESVELLTPTLPNSTVHFGD